MFLFSLGFLTAMSSLLLYSQVNILWVCFPLVIIIFLYISRKNINLRLLLMAAGFCSGMIYALISAHLALSHKLKFIPDNEVSLIGVVSGLPVKSDLGSRGIRSKFVFDVSTAGENFPVRKILMSWYNPGINLKAGQKWQFNAKLKPIYGYANPGSFDYSKWLFREGFDAIGSVKEARLIENDSINPLAKIDQLRQELADFINVKIGDSRVSSLVRALTLGDKSQISFQDNQIFQNTGTSHLIAISGLHIGLVAFFGIFIGRLLFFIFPLQAINRFHYEAVFAIIFAVAYSFLAGLSIPTIRALVMVSVFSLSYAYKLKISRWQSWSLALLIVLLIQPLSPLDAGFWFSFTAVALLIYGFSGRGPPQSRFIMFLKAQWIILIGLFPFMIIVFGKLNLLTPLSNILILPLASLVIIPLIFITLMVSMVSGVAGSYLFTIVGYSINLFFWMLDSLANLDFLSVTIPRSGISTIISVFIFSIILLLPRLFRWKYVSVILLFPIVFNKSDNNISDSEFLANILDVGQGLSIVIRTKEHVLIYDTGAKYESGFSMATAVVIPFLNDSGITSVDKLVLSHRDNDHAGGTDDIVKQFPNVIVHKVDDKKDTCQFPLSWVWDEVRFEVLSPYSTEPYLENNSSCVLKISSIFGSMLLTGDIEEPVEYRLVHQSKDKIESNVILVPHHGSRTSSSLQFIKAVNPRIAVNSSGFVNQFHHPHPLIKQLYDDLGIQFYDTQNSGMIEVGFKNNGISVGQFRDMNKHLWNIDLKEAGYF